MKEWVWLEVKNHRHVGTTVVEWQKKGRRLHTYQAAGSAGPMSSFVNHFLLLEKDE